MCFIVIRTTERKWVCHQFCPLFTMLNFNGGSNGSGLKTLRVNRSKSLVNTWRQRHFSSRARLKTASVCVSACVSYNAVSQWDRFCMCFLQCSGSGRQVLYVFLSMQWLRETGSVCVSACVSYNTVSQWDRFCMCFCLCFLQCSVSGRQFLYVFLSMQWLSETGPVCVSACVSFSAVAQWDSFCMCFFQCSGSVKQVVYVFLPVFLAVQCLRETGCVCVSACVSYNAVSQWDRFCMCFFQCSGSVRRVVYVFLPVFLTMQCISETGSVCVSACVSYNAVSQWDSSCMCFFQCSGSVRQVLYVFLPVFLTMQCLSETGCVCVSTCVSFNAVPQWDSSCMCFCLCFLQCSVSVRQVLYMFLPVFLSVQCLSETGSVCVSACVSYNAVSQWDRFCMCFFQCSGSVRQVVYVFLPVFLTMQCLSETGSGCVSFNAVSQWDRLCMCFFQCSGSVRQVLYVFLPVFLTMQCLSETGSVYVSACVSFSAVSQWDRFCMCFFQCSGSVRQVLYVFLPVFLTMQCLSETGSVCVSACVSYNAVSQWDRFCMCFFQCSGSVRQVLYVFLYVFLSMQWLSETGPVCVSACVSYNAVTQWDRFGICLRLCFRLKTITTLPLHVEIQCVSITNGHSHILAGLKDGKVIIVGIKRPSQVK